MTDSKHGTGGLRVLIAIASYGEKNLRFLKEIIQKYRNMTFNVDVVVVSDAPKDLGHDTKVVVGLPAKNPWSLPFAHKAIFAENADRFDLFIYSEDDMDVTEENIQAFVRASAALKPDQIAGYLRYETGQDGAKVLTDVHGNFHWQPESAAHSGGYTVAEFTNEHAAFYILTQSQLKRAIASGGFLRDPYEGRYDMLCSAATDPYTSCGFHKVICVSVLESFLIRHMSNLYVSRHGISLAEFQQQVQALLKIADGVHPRSTLGPVEPKVFQPLYSKSFYEKPREDILRMVPGDARSILSIGCGWGAVEADLQHRGVKVTVLPLDSVIGVAAGRLGLEVVNGSLPECLDALGERRFDCVLISDLLHLQKNPGHFLEQCSRFVTEGGALVIGGPNFNRAPNLVKRVLGVDGHQRLRSYEESGISLCGPATVAGHLKSAGFCVRDVRWLSHALPGKRLERCRISLGSFTAKEWVVRARRIRPAGTSVQSPDPSGQ